MTTTTFTEPFELIVMASLIYDGFPCGERETWPAIWERVIEARYAMADRAQTDRIA